MIDDPARLTEKRSCAPHDFFVGEAAEHFTYTYDTLGNMTNIADARWTGTRAFTYDGLNRLISASGPFGGTTQSPASEIYKYNAIGNFTQKASITYSYGDPLHPAAVTATSDGRSYTYDANGNTLSGAERPLVFDTDNRVSSITNATGTSTFAYDYLGLRGRKTSAAGTTRYPLPNYEVGPAGVVTKYFSDVAKKSNGEVLYYHRDHLGSVHVITNSTGAKAQLVEYDPWGRVSREEGNVDVSHRFTDQELDGETRSLQLPGPLLRPGARALREPGSVRAVSSESAVVEPLQLHDEQPCKPDRLDRVRRRGRRFAG